MTNRQELRLDNTGKYVVEQKQHTDQAKKMLTPWGMVSEATNLGLSTALPMAIGAPIGLFLDKHFDSTPKLTLSLLVFGIIVGIYNFYRYIKKIAHRN